MSNNSQFHTTSPYHRQIHITDMDKIAPTKAQAERDNNNNYEHNITRKGGFKTPVPIYKFDTVHNPALRNIKRFADERHRVATNRNQVRFNRTHSRLMSRAFQ